MQQVQATRCVTARAFVEKKKQKQECHYCRWLTNECYWFLMSICEVLLQALSFVSVSSTSLRIVQAPKSGKRHELSMLASWRLIATRFYWRKFRQLLDIWESSPEDLRALNLFSTCARPYKSYQVHQHFSVFPCFSIIRSLFYSFCTLSVFLQDSPALARMLTGWCSEQLEMYIDSEESPETKLQPLLLCNTFHGPWDMDTTLRDVFACVIYID